MTVGPFETIGLLVLLFLGCLIPIVLIIYWMIKIFKNSKDNILVNKQILEELKKANK